MPVDPEKWVLRAQLWFSGQLPSNQRVQHYDVQVQGPNVLGDAGALTEYNAFACLVVAQQQIEYALLTVGDDEALVNSQAIREIINGFEPSDADVQQHRLIVNRWSPGLTAALRWQAATQIATLYDVPLAMLAIGKTATGNELVVVQRSILVAPLRRVAQAFRGAAPLL